MLRRFSFLPLDTKRYKVLMRRERGKVSSRYQGFVINVFFSTIEVSQVVGISSRLVGSGKWLQKLKCQSIGPCCRPKVKINNEEFAVK